MVWRYWAIAITRYRTVGCSRVENFVYTYVDIGTETVFCPGAVMDT
jgi:hypothetical protein